MGATVWKWQNGKIFEKTEKQNKDKLDKHENEDENEELPENDVRKYLNFVSVDPTNTPIEYDYEDGRLFIRKNFVMFIADMFGLTPKQSQLKIYEWFTVTEDVFPEYMESPYLEGFWKQNAPRRDGN